MELEKSEIELFKKAAEKILSDKQPDIVGSTTIMEGGYQLHRIFPESPNQIEFDLSIRFGSWQDSRKYEGKKLYVKVYIEDATNKDDDKCKKCGGIAKPGKCTINELISFGDFGGDAKSPGTTLSRLGDAKIIDCTKCTVCGHSWVNP